MDSRLHFNSQPRIGIRLLAALCCIATLLTLIPLFAISFYNHPYYDDFAAGGVLTQQVWQDTHSVWALLLAAFSGAQKSYMNWEGNYVPNYLNCIQVSAISQELCFLVTWVLLLAVILSWGYLCKVLLRDVLKAPWPVCWMATAVIVFLSVQFVPHANEAFFWQSGGIKYTLGHAWLVALSALSIRLTCGTPMAKRAYALKTAFLCMLALLCAGSNLMTGMGAVVGICLYALYLWLYKRKEKWPISLGAVFALMGYAVNVLAPGNALRQGPTMAGHPFVWTVVQSATETLEYIGRWTTLPWMAALTLLTPFALAAARKCSVSCKHPVLVLIGSFAMLASQLAPPIYTGIYYDSGRIVNTMYLSYCLFMLINWASLVGYAAGRISQKEGASEAASLQIPEGFSPLKRGMSLGLVMALVATIIVGCAGYGLTKMPGGAALKSLANGQAARYDLAYEERTALLTAETDLPVTMERIEDIPLVFMDETFAWKSIMSTVGSYYGKEIVDGSSQ